MCSIEMFLKGSTLLKSNQIKSSISNDDQTLIVPSTMTHSSSKRKRSKQIKASAVETPITGSGLNSTQATHATEFSSTQSIPSTLLQGSREFFLQLPQHLWVNIFSEWLTLQDLSHVDSVILNHEFRRDWLTILPLIASHKETKRREGQENVKGTQESGEIESKWKIQCNSSQPLIDMLKWLKKRKLSTAISHADIYCLLKQTSLLEDIDRWLPLLVPTCQNLSTLSLVNITVLFDPDLLPLIQTCAHSLQNCTIINCLSLSMNSFVEIINHCPKLKSLTYIDSGGLFGPFLTSGGFEKSHYTTSPSIPTNTASVGLVQSFPKRLSALNIGESHWDMKFIEHVLKTFRELESFQVSFLHYHGHDYHDNSNKKKKSKASDVEKPYTHYEWIGDSDSEEDSDSDDEDIFRLFANRLNLQLSIEEETFRLFKIIKKYAIQLKQISISVARELIEHKSSSRKSSFLHTPHHGATRRGSHAHHHMSNSKSRASSHFPSSSGAGSGFGTSRQQHAKHLSREHDKKTSDSTNEYTHILSYFTPFLTNLERLVICCMDRDLKDSDIVVECLPEHIQCLTKYAMIQEISVLEANSSLNYNPVLQKVAHSRLTCLQSLKLGKQIAITTETLMALSQGCPAIRELDLKDTLIHEKTFQSLGTLFPHLEALEIFSTKDSLDLNLFPVLLQLSNQLHFLGIYCPTVGFTGEVFTKLQRHFYPFSAQHGRKGSNKGKPSAIDIAVSARLMAENKKGLLALNSVNIRSDTLNKQHLTALVTITPNLQECLLTSETLNEDDLISCIHGWKHLRVIDFQSLCKLTNRTLQALIDRASSGHHGMLTSITLENICSFTSALLQEFACKYRFNLQRLYLNLPHNLAKVVWSDLLQMLHVLEDENISERVMDDAMIARMTMKHDNIWIKRALKHDSYMLEWSLKECS